ncbi:MAG: hypothetical protein IPM92_00640 [Saprospiraceae bacterium]|nr:hypothetical protein [Saprospiraceae bacterium]
MKAELSQLLYTTYIKHWDSQVEIQDKKGNVTKGYVSGIYLDRSDGHHIRIDKWHIVQHEDRYNLGLYPLGFMKGVIVEQKEIRSLIFENNAIEFRFEE